MPKITYEYPFAVTVTCTATNKDHILVVETDGSTGLTATCEHCKNLILLYSIWDKISGTPDHPIKARI